MIARKCDACGDYYDENKNEYGIECVEFKRWVTKPGYADGGCYETKNKLDLCDGCVHEIMRYIDSLGTIWD